MTINSFKDLTKDKNSMFVTDKRACMVNVWKESLNRLKSEGILLAVIPFIGTLAAFSFETGYLNYFGVPWNYVEIGLPQILSALVLIALFLGLIWPMTARCLALFHSGVPGVKEATMASILLALLLLGIWLFGFGIKLAFLLGFLLIAVLLFLLRRQYEKSENFKNEQKFFVTVVNGVDQVLLKGRKISETVMTPLWVLSGALICIAMIGYLFASWNSNSWVMTSNPNYIFVRRYGDSYIFKEYDPRLSKLLASVKTLKLGDGKEIEMKKIYIPNLEGEYTHTALETFLEMIKQ